MTVRRFAERRQWPLRGIRARLRAEAVGGRYEEIDVELVLEGDLTDEQRARLREVAERCIISQTLRSGVPVRLA